MYIFTYLYIIIANRAKNIVNKPLVNEDENVRTIRELRLQIEKYTYIHTHIYIYTQHTHIYIYSISFVYLK